MESSATGDDALLPKLGDVLATRHGKYKVEELIGKGTYGAVYKVTRTTDMKLFAIKCEKASTPDVHLSLDVRVLGDFMKHKSQHFCIYEDRGRIDGRFQFVVMELVGKTLRDLRLERESKMFSLGTSQKAAAQCLICIEELHRIGYLYRDVNPGNFAAGRVEEKKHHFIYMLDFGLCRQYHENGKDCRIQREVAPFRGTIPYASLDAMKLKEQSRKDDLEGWLYMTVEWTSGSLPWRKFNNENRAEVMKMKEDLRSNDKSLDNFLKNCPKVHFSKLLEYIEGLTYYSIPDYVFVYMCVRHAMIKNNIRWADPLDWDEGTAYMAPKEEPGDGQKIKPPKDEDDKECGRGSKVEKKSDKKDSKME